MAETDNTLESHIKKFLEILLPSEREELRSRIEECRKIHKEDASKEWLCIMSLGYNVAAYNSRRQVLLLDELADIFLKATKENKIANKPNKG